MLLIDDIRDAIAKNLPQQVGEELRKRLEKAEVDAKVAADTVATLSAEKTAHAATRAALDIAKQELSAHAKLAEREKAVADRESKAEVAMLTAQLQSTNANVEFARNVAMGLVRNVEYRNNVFGGGTVPVVRDSSPGYQTVESHSTSSHADHTRTAT